MFWFLLLLVVIAAVTWLYLRGEDLSRFDHPLAPAVTRTSVPGAGTAYVSRVLQDITQQLSGTTWRGRIEGMRRAMDQFGIDAQVRGTLVPVDNDLVRGEWLLPPDCDPRRRLLYIHGGAWIAGSPLSHRTIVDRFAAAADAAVFSLDYRLMPEHSRMDSIVDCRAAYEWILVNGPDGPTPLDFLAVAGDSAGGNLTLATVAWARDEGLRPADRVVALSPATDAAMTGPSMRRNELSDLMLGPQFGQLNRFPLPLLWWATWLLYRIPPADPMVSPVRGDLSGLPPTLVHVSADEMLLDDARRYVNRAQASGSPATLQIWTGMVHVWHIFAGHLPEADEAFAEIAAFLASSEDGAEPEWPPAEPEVDE
jgi:epsilon-lactone hydrolase